MEHMYVHSVVLRKCVGLMVAMYLEHCNVSIYYLELSYMQPSCCRGFSTTKILPNPKLE